MPKIKKIHIFVVVVVLAAVGFLAWRTYSKQSGGESRWPELAGGVYAEAVHSGGLSYLVPPDEVYENGMGKDGHPRLLDPKLVDITAADTKIADDLNGIDVEVNGQHRFYPFQILNWHEVVHDTFGDKPLLITYSSLTGSAVVYEATVNGEVRQFGDSGKVYNNATLLYDDSSETLWNQTSGQAIVGKDVGQKLTIYPSVVMRWDEWKDAYPSGLAMSTDTGFTRDYGRHPYGSYETSSGIFFPLNFTYEYVRVKDIVYRLDYNNQTAIFSTRFLGAQNEPNLTLGEGIEALQAVALMNYDNFRTRVFDRHVGEQVLTFTREGKDVIKDAETGTTWSLDGLGLKGQLAGTQLELIPVTRHYGFAHMAMFPDTFVSGEEIFYPIKSGTSDGEGNIIIE